PASALTAAGVIIAVGVVVTVIEQVAPKSRRFLPSPTGVGLAFVLPFYQSFAIFLGAVVAWAIFKAARPKAEKYTIPAASGLIAGESLMAVLIIAVMKLLGEV
ncbi:MAG: OPT/YSL family transporter, partial [Candidatus Sericytochromatia bacterium]